MVAINISPAHSQDSSCSSSSRTISPTHSYASTISTSSSRSSLQGKSPNFRKHNKKHHSSILNVLAILRVIVLASALVFLLVCVLQSQHLVLHEDGVVSQTGQPTLLHHNKKEWKVSAATYAPKSSSSVATSTGSSFHDVFQSKLTQWRQHTHRLAQRDSLQRLRQQQEPPSVPSKKASPTSRLLHESNATSSTRQRQQLHIPFWEQQTLFRSRNSWHLMVVVMADDCLHNYRALKRVQKYPTLLTLQDAVQTSHADIVVYFPQTPHSHLFPEVTNQTRNDQLECQATLQALIQQEYASNLQSGQLQLIQGITNPLPPRVAYEYHHLLPAALHQVETMGLPRDQIEVAKHKVQRKLQLQQLQVELDYSLGVDFAYVAELVYEYADGLLVLQAGTTLNKDSAAVGGDYAARIATQYEHFQQRLDKDLLVHRFCYMSFLKQDEWIQLPTGNQTYRELPPRFQQSLGALPTGIVLEKHGLYRLSMVLRSLLPYRKATTTHLLMQYCDELLWEAQVLQPVNTDHLVALHTQNQTTSLDMETAFPPALFVVEQRVKVGSNATTTQPPQSIPDIRPELVQRELERIQQHLEQSASLLIPPWVTVDHRQVGSQRTTNPADLIQLPGNTTTNTNTNTTDRKLVTFVVPTSTRPNGIKNQYVTYSLNQLFPLIRRDFQLPNGQLQASVLLVICGNTQDELDDHQAGLWEYYGPEIQQGILDIVSTNLETYPSLHELPNNYGDEENRLRWRSKQNLDISSSFFAAKGKSEYVMLLEDDTGYRDKFTPTLKALIESDQRQSGALIPDPQKTGKGPFADDYRQHIFAQVHFGFGYSGVLIHDDDALVYAVMHYVLMDEKPCDLLYLANYIQGQVLDQKWRWQLKRVLLTHLGSVSSLKGKFQPVWGLKG